MVEDGNPVAEQSQGGAGGGGGGGGGQQGQSHRPVNPYQGMYNSRSFMSF
jgi:hypothetical protein